MCVFDAVCPAGKSAAERRAGYRCVTEKAVPQALCASGGFVGAPGNAKPFARLSRGSVFPMPSRGENGGLCPHPPKGSIPWESLFGGRRTSLHLLPHPPNAAGGKPLLVGLPPSPPVSAPCGTKRSTHAPYSWGMGASTQRRRHWLAALPP